MAKGPTPLPSALKVLRGKKAPKSEPQPAAGEPPMPTGLSEPEAVVWRRVVAELQTCPGLLTLADRGVVELVARIEPMFIAAAEHVRENGSTVIARDDKGAVRFVQNSPEAQLVVKLSAQLKSLYAELGLTPAGRSRLSIAPSKERSKLSAFLGGKSGA